MSKKAAVPAPAHAPATTTAVPAKVEPSLSDWFERWPDLFARRWPESLAGISLFEEKFRMEQFVDDDGTLVVRGELPGMNPDEDVTITAGDGRLTIAAVRENRTEESKDGKFRSEFHYGSFQRSITLPAGAQADDVTATYTDGILEVRIPVDTAADTVKTVQVTRMAKADRP